MHQYFQQPHEGGDDVLNRRGTDPAIEIIMHKMVKVEASMEKVADALTKLAVIEERQSADRAALERAFDAIQRSDARCAKAFEETVEKLEGVNSRVAKLEQAAPLNNKTNQWVMDALKWCAVIVATFVAVKVGLKP